MREIAAEAGLHAFTHSDGSSGRKFFVEQMGGGVAILDYDGDGLQDLYFVTGGPLPGYKGERPLNRLFRNRGNWRFEDVTSRAGVGCGKYAIGAAAGDYDNDGDVDLYVTCFGPNVLYRNNGDGTFANVTAEAGVGDRRLSSSAAWGDYDGDGDLDLYVANYVKYRLQDDLWCSKFAGHKSYCGPTLYDPEEHTLYENLGNGRFRDVSVAAGIRRHRENGLGVLWLDFDEDGRQDILVADDQSPNLLWHNLGGGRFENVASDLGIAYGEEGNARAGMGVDGGDFDNDGREDVVITNFSEESNGLYRREESSYRDVAFPLGIGPRTLMMLGFGAGFVDYDRDGRLDLFFANGHVLDDIEKYSDAVRWAMPCQLFRNAGSSGFVDVSASTTVDQAVRVSRGAAFGDLDNDGRPDVVVSVLRGKPLLFRNEAAPGARWLGLELRPRRGNRFGVGALVTLTAGGLNQMRRVRAGASYASTNDPRPLFGLGSARTVDVLRVRWPDGKTTEIKDPPLDRYLQIDETGFSGDGPGR